MAAYIQLSFCKTLLKQVLCIRGIDFSQGHKDTEITKLRAFPGEEKHLLVTQLNDKPVNKVPKPE